MQISIIGTGRIGLCLGAVLGEAHFKILFTDKDKDKLQKLSKKQISFYEPYLEEILKKNWSQFDWTSSKEDIISSDILFLTLSAKTTQNKQDLSEIFNWCEIISKNTNKEKILIIKSTFPIGTNHKLNLIVQKHTQKISIITCPEFLRQGYAIQDIKKGDRLVIGSQNPIATKKVESIYKSFYTGQVIHTDPVTAELSKLASNSFLSLKISFTNEISQLTKKYQANREDLKCILETDSRIGSSCLNSGLGFGGYCLPKDLQMIIEEGQKENLDMKLLKATQEVNNEQVPYFLKSMIKYFKNLKDKSFAFWGLTFKKDTDDVRGSPALTLARQMLDEGAELHIYEPLLQKKEIVKLFPQKKVFIYDTALESLKNKDGLILGTDCEKFFVSLKDIKKELKIPFILDGRNLFSQKDLKEEGFDCI